MSSNVEFETDKIAYPTRSRVSSGFVGNSNSFGANNEPKMVRWLMKKGIVKSPAAAQVVLITMVIINLIITYIIIKYFL